MSWDEFGFKKGDLAFVAQNYETNELITILVIAAKPLYETTF